MPDIKHANNAPRCSHIKFDGARCGAPALHGREHCRFHYSSSDFRAPFPVVEDGLSLQVALVQILRGILDGSLDRKTTGLALYTCQIMCANLKRIQEDRKLDFKTDDYVPGPSLAEILLERLQLVDEPGNSDPVNNPPDPWHSGAPPRPDSTAVKSSFSNSAAGEFKAEPVVIPSPGKIDKLEACLQQLPDPPRRPFEAFG